MSDAFIEVSGAPAIRKLFYDLFQEDLDCVYGMTDIDAVQKHFPEFKYTYALESRVEAGVPAKLLYTAQEGAVYNVTDTQDNRESRYLPELLFTDVTVMGDYVVLVDLKGTANAIAIKSPVATSLFTNLFDYLWAISEKYN